MDLQMARCSNPPAKFTRFCAAVCFVLAAALMTFAHAHRTSTESASLAKPATLSNAALLP